MSSGETKSSKSKGDAGETDAAGQARHEGYLKETVTETGVPVHMPTSWRFITYFFVAFAVATLVLLSMGTIARKDTVRGILTLGSSEIKLEAPRLGRVTKIYASEGQSVKRGQALAKIVIENDALTEKTNALLVPMERRAITQRLKKEWSNYYELTTQLRIETEKLRIAKKKAELVKGLEPTYDSGPLQHQKVEYDYLDQANTVGDTKLKLNTLVGDIEQDDLLLKKLSGYEAARRPTIVGANPAVREIYVESQVSNEVILKAPLDGTITFIRSKLVTSTDPGEPLLMMAPAKAPLLGVAYVPSKLTGSIRPKQTVKLMFDAFPYQRFGLAEGEVASISFMPLNRSEIKAPQANDAAYKVTINVKNSGAVPSYSSQLRPGMAFAADIISERRSFLAILLEPLIAAGKRV